MQRATVPEDTDARVGELLQVLEPFLGDTALIVVSDHGELLGEHEVVGHGYWVWEGLTHVPLIGVGVGELPDTLGIAAVPDLMTGALGVEHQWAVRASDAVPMVAQREGKLALSPDGRFKGVWDKELQVFDLQEDPGELRPLKEKEAWLESERKAWEASTPAGSADDEGVVTLHSDTIEALRALGYFDEEEAPESSEPN